MSGTNKEKAMILGTGFVLEPDGSTHPTIRGQERLHKALEFYHDMGGRVLLLCTGGYSGLVARTREMPEGIREAYVMADYLMSEGGVRHEDIEVEPNSTSTITNFTYAMRDGLIVPSEHTRASPLGVITHPYHMNRAGLVADKLDVTIQAIPTDEYDNKWHERRLYYLYKTALLGAHGITDLEQRGELLATVLNRLRR